MKQPVVIYALIMSSLILSSCKKSANEQSAAPATDSVAQTPQKETGFDISKIPVSDKDLGISHFSPFPKA